MLDSTNSPTTPVLACPIEGCTRMQLIEQRQDAYEGEMMEFKVRTTTLFDRLFARFDALQWWLIGLMGGVVVTLITAIIGLIVMVSKRG